ncbi:hypothetical protein DBV39_09875 [Orrella marina]|uniref:Uncharacterized protein n=1 Tax=Orrella marina TaxID=2163011 RepID=A0A2R4XJL6_9BURK|nr:hypothetical protein DBV39_09875 [Orrella marina]
MLRAPRLTVDFRQTDRVSTIPDRQHIWSIVGSGELPAPLVNVKQRLENHQNLRKKFDWYSGRLYMVHRLAEREDDDLYKKAVLPQP